jgi:hypothetical protein
MCPACITMMAAVAAGVVSTGTLGAMVVTTLGVRKTASVAKPNPQALDPLDQQQRRHHDSYSN